MSSSTEFEICVGARGSQLSRAQVKEVLNELRFFHPRVKFLPIWITTSGDKDLKTSLKTLDKTDFFTKEIDALLLSGKFRIAIHSAKDLPEPLAKGLKLAALTKGVNPSDVIVLRDHETVQDLPQGAKIGTSSARREQNVFKLRKDLMTADIRGTIESRLQQLDEGHFDGVVMAEAALIRLNLTHRNRIFLPGDRAELQGQLAVVIREDDQQMQDLFRCLDVRV